MLNGYKCEKCGTVTRAVIRPHRCPGCGARRAYIYEVVPGATTAKRSQKGCTV